MRTLFLVSMLCFIFAACEDEDNNTNNNQFTEGTIEGEVDGTMVSCSYRPPDVTGQNQYDYYDESFNLIFMSRYKSSTDLRGWTVDITDDLDALTVPKTYDGSSLDFTVSYYTGIGGGFYGNTDNSTLTITGKSGDVIEGTFSGELEDLFSGDTYTVTNGRFKVQVERK